MTVPPAPLFAPLLTSHMGLRLSCDRGLSNRWDDRPLRGFPVTDLVELRPQLTVWAGDLEHGPTTAFCYAEAAASLPVAECDLVGEHDHVAFPRQGAASMSSAMVQATLWSMDAKTSARLRRHYR